MAGQLSDLMFDIVARDQTRAGFDSAGRNADLLASKAAQAGRRVEDGMRSASGEVSHLGAQFNDIVVSLMGGMSPGVVALQQGTQIAQAFGSQGAAGALRMTGGALMGLLNPLGLITIAAIAAGGYLLQMFIGAEKEAKKSEETLKQFDALIERIGKTSADSASQIKKMLETPATWAALRADIAETERALRGQLTGAVGQLSTALQSLDTEGAKARFLEMHDPIFRAKQELVALGYALDDGTMSAQQVKDRLDEMATAQTTPSSLYDTIAALRVIAESAISAKSKLDALGTATKGGRVGRNNFDDLGRIADNSGAVSDYAARLGLFDADDLSKKLKDQAKSLHEVAGGHARAKTEAEKHAEAVGKLMQSLDDEQAKLHMTATEQRVLDELRRAGADAASAEGIAIAEKVRSIEAEKSAMKDLKENLDLAKSSATDFLATFRQGIVSGEGAIKSFGNAVLGVLDKIASKIESSFVDSLFDPGGILGSLFSSGSTDPWSGLRTVSAAPSAGASAMAAAAKGVSRPAALSKAAAMSSAMAPATRVEIDMKANGEWQAHVSNASRAEASSVVATSVPRMVKGGLDIYRKGAFHDDVEKHAKRRRVKGS